MAHMLVPHILQEEVVFQRTKSNRSQPFLPSGIRLNHDEAVLEVLQSLAEEGASGQG